MSSANVELVRSIFAAWERSDFSSTEWADPEIEYVFAGGGPDDGNYSGLAGMADAWKGWLEGWKDFRGEAEEYRELDDRRVLVLSRATGQGKASGVELARTQAQAAVLFHLRGDKVTRLVIYADHEQALADLGLAPEME